MRILLIRHGRSAHVSSRTLLDRAGVERWRADYDAAGIIANDEPPLALRSSVERADVLVASDLPRAIASAKRLVPQRPVSESPLFRELPLPIPSIARLRAPLSVWGALIHARWILDIARRQDATSEALEQARLATEWCRTTCCEHRTDCTLAVVTHGVFRRLLARQLVEDGWRLESRRRSYAHWSVWALAARGENHTSAAAY